MTPRQRRNTRSAEGIERKRLKKNKRKRPKTTQWTERQRLKTNKRKRLKTIQYKQRKRQRDADRISNNRECSDIITNYEITIQEGPTIVCISCRGLFFKKSVTNLRRDNLIAQVGIDLIQNVTLNSIEHLVRFCATCRRDVLQGKIPRLCIANGLQFPVIPDELVGLTELEERLVSPRLPFTQIRELGVDKQYGVRGNVVNVPISVQKSIDVMPRTFNNTDTIQLKLKRRRDHISSYRNEDVRPLRVYRAAEYLVRQPLFVEEGISLSLDWNELHPAEAEPFIVDMDDRHGLVEPLPTNDNTRDEWDETVGDENVNPGNDQTLLKEGLVFAPGEGVRPISLLSDVYAEELSFPTIYCGQKREFAIKLTCNERIKSELRRDDRRCCKIPKIFYCYRLKEMLALRNAINICLRKSSQQSRLSAGQALQSDTIQQLLTSDEAFKVLANDRSSPSYWQQKMRELMAMVRQLGVPTFFLTLSAAETHWPELLVILVKVLHNRSISHEESLQMSYIEKCDLIRSDPVTCARYFDHRFRELFKLIQSETGPFVRYKVLDSYCRIEFQHRGSPHVHCLLWLENAPQYYSDCPQSRIDCEAFISKFITCSTNVSETKHLVKYQYHKHSKSCRRFKDDTAICRFGIPYYPMPRTLILEPHNLDELTDELEDEIDGRLDAIDDKLVDIDKQIRQCKETPISLTFDELLQSLAITEEQYIQSVRYGLKRSKVFLKRDPADIRTNGYNTGILCRHRANLDLQFVLDPYSCVHYILNYINKSNRGMSNLLRSVVEDCKSGYVSHQQKLYRVCSAFLNASEVSAQEAVYVLLSMPLSISSRPSIFINTGEREKRTRILKAERDLQELDPESTDIMVLGLLEYYQLRPTELESTTLAEFAANYNYSKTKKWTYSEEEPVEPTDEQNQDINDCGSEEEQTVFKLNDGKGWLKKRTVPKVIRYRKYQLEKDPKNYFRELCMLFLPWRNEDTDLLQIDCCEKFLANREQIALIESQFVNNSNTDYDDLQIQVETDAKAEMAEEMAEELDNELAIYDLERRETSFGTEFGANKINNNNNQQRGSFAMPMVLKDDQYSQLVRCLNHKQRKYLLGMISLVKQSTEPLHHFVTGGAGTGKSVLISAIFQSLVRYYSFRYPEAADKVKVLLLGPTGKSAFHIGGTTIHSAFGLTVTANNNRTPMSADTRSTYRHKYWYLKMLIIDEISMVGAQTFRKIDEQLQQIFETNQSFGGLSVLCFGDFNQLKPVMDRFIFLHPSNSDYSPVAGPILWQQFQYYRLDELMRQKDDLAFAQALNNLSTGDLDDEDKALFESRLFERNSEILPTNAIRLFSTNERVDRYNRLAISRSQEIGYIVESHDYVAQNWCERIKSKAIERVAQMPTANTYGLPKSVELKVGIRYMITTNIEISDGMVNGTSGVLRSIDFTTINGNPTPQTLWFEFESDRIGLSARSMAPSRQHSDRFLTPVCKVVRDINMRTEAKLVLVSRRQFPVVAAEAITFHKAQGQTYDQVVVDLSGSLDLAKLYTAFSRARTSTGLFVTGIAIRYSPKRMANNPVSMELDRLERMAKLEFELKFLSEMAVPIDSLTIVFHNIQYLPNHVEDLRADKSLMAAQLLVFVESRANNVLIPGYQIMAQLDADIPKPFGIVFYCRMDVCTRFESVLCTDVLIHKDAHLEYLALDFGGRIFLALYISPGYPKQTAIEQLCALIQSMSNTQKEIVVFGDFNIDRKSPNGQCLVDRFVSLGLRLCSPDGQPTNTHGNQIDYIFGTELIVDSWVYETVGLDHKPIFAII